MYRCIELPRFSLNTLAAVRRAFRDSTRIPLRQSWRPRPQAAFAPAVVSLGWRGNSLLVFAELTDRDIFTHAKKPNQRMWELGDVFEIFLCPVRQAAYYEFHVTPNNQWLQLRFGDSSVVKKLQKTNDFTSCVITKKVFHSWVWLRRKEQKWFVYAEIPATVICEHKSKRGPWLFSFGRYDYTRDRKAPVISSTSPHTKPNFHARHEWEKMQFYKQLKGRRPARVAASVE